MGDLYRTIVEHLPYPVVVVAADGRVEYANGEVEAVLGYTLDDIPTIERWFARAYPDEAVRQRLAAEWAADLADATRTRLGPRTVTVTGKDGREHAVMLIVERLADGRLVVVMVDDTERATASDALQRSNDRYRFVSQLTSDYSYAFRVAPDGELEGEWATGALERITGYTFDELKASGGWESLLCADDLPIAYAQLEGLLAGNQSVVEYRVVAKDGQLRWMRDAARPVFEGDRLVRIIGAVRDITELKHAEDRLRDSARRYRMLVEAASDGIFVLDAGGCFLAANPAGQALLGYDEQELRERSIDQLTVAADDGGPGVDLEVVRAGLVALRERELRRVDGTTVWTEESASLLPDDNVQLIVRDVTARRRAEQQRRKLDEQQRHARRLETMGRLAGGVAHDFNNLLTVIRSYAELVRRRLEREGSSAAGIGEIEHAAERAATLTQQLLAFGRKQVLEPSELDLNAIVERAHGMLGRVLGESIDVVVALAERLPPIWADASQMDQVIVNLAVNARDAMPDGGTLRIATRADGGGVLLIVEDSGHGMDKQTRTRVFEPFFTTKGQSAGTGLGLSTVYGIVRQSGGTIDVSSELGRGARFELRFPAATDAVREPPARAAESSPRPASSRPGTILVAEDDDAVRRTIEQTLEMAGHRVLSAADGERARALSDAHDGAIDVLLSDVVMPGMGGLELAERMMVDRPATRVLLVSGYSDQLVTSGLGADQRFEFLRKPFSPNELLARVAALVGGGAE